MGFLTSPGTCLELLVAAGGLGAALESAGETDARGLDPPPNSLQMMVQLFSERDPMVLWACLLVPKLVTPVGSLPASPP